jgi:hypothetical protein
MAECLKKKLTIEFFFAISGAQKPFDSFFWENFLNPKSKTKNASQYEVRSRVVVERTA